MARSNSSCDLTGRKLGTGKPCSARKVFFGDAVLSDAQDPTGRADRHHWLNGFQSFGRHILKLSGDDSTPACQIPRRCYIGVRRRDFIVGNLTSRAIGCRVQDDDPITHPLRRNGDHPTQLPTTKDSDRVAGQNNASHIAPPFMECPQVHSNL
jgi:hypothetical protein